MKNIKRKLISLGLGGALLIGTVYAMNEGDTILTRDYVDDILEPQMEQEMNAHIKSYMEEGYDNSVASLDALYQEQKSQLELGMARSNTVMSPMDYGQGDTVRLNTGATLLVTHGRVELIHDGVVIDATTGTLCASGSYTQTGHRYIVGEDTQCSGVVVSGIARMGYEGVFGYSSGSGKNCPFYDVYVTDDYSDAVTFVYNSGLFQGVEEGEFSPSTTMTRAMVVTVLYRLAGEPANQMAVAEGSFTDVATDAWYADYVRWSASVGVSGGMGDGTFAPQSGVTMVQMIQFLYNFGTNNLGLTLSGTADLSTVDGGDTVPDWGMEATQWAVSSGVWTQTLASREITRAEVATMLMNFSQIYG